GDLTSGLNDTVIFRATASGNGPLFYQWMQNGIPIAGATSDTLVRTNIIGGDAGIYSVAVGNAAGTVVSGPAVLTVLDIKMFAGLIINGLAGRNYRIEYQNALGPNTWNTLTT